MNPTDEIVLFDLVLEAKSTPQRIRENTEVSESYLRTRLQSLEKWNRVEKLTRGLYRPTEKGRDEILEELDVDLGLVLAYRLIDQELNVLGEDDRMVLQFVDETVAAFRSSGAVAVGDEHIDLRLDPMDSWDDADAVRDAVDAVKPEKDESD